MIDWGLRITISEPFSFLVFFINVSGDCKAIVYNKTRFRAPTSQKKTIKIFFGFTLDLIVYNFFLKRN